jgi:plasmid stability protein
MSSITIRNLDPAVKERLRIRAAQHGHSMEAEARSILQSTLKEPERLPARNLYERIRALRAPWWRGRSRADAASAGSRSARFD